MLACRLQHSRRGSVAPYPTSADLDFGRVTGCTRDPSESCFSGRRNLLSFALVHSFARVYLFFWEERANRPRAPSASHPNGPLTSFRDRSEQTKPLMRDALYLPWQMALRISAWLPLYFEDLRRTCPLPTRSFAEFLYLGSLGRSQRSHFGVGYRWVSCLRFKNCRPHPKPSRLASSSDT